MTTPDGPGTLHGRASAAPSEPIDDPDLGRLVREAADGWSMPPVHLDRPGWRERVRTPRSRRTMSVLSLTGHLAGAAGAGVGLTVAAALLGVYLTRPTGPASPTQRPVATPAGTPRPGPSSAAASELPQLLVNGDLPVPSQLIAKIGSTFAFVDLRAGTVGPAIGDNTYGTDVRRSPDGTVYCICLAEDGYTNGSFGHMTATWKRYDATGAAAKSNVVGDFRGGPDPRDAGAAEQPQNVAIRVTYGPDPGVAFVGWSTHVHPAWKSGIIVVDVTSGQVLQRLDLPDSTDGSDTTRTAIDAARVIGAIGAGRVAISRPYYRWSPSAGSMAGYQPGTDAYLATFGGTRLSGLDTIAAAAGCASQVATAGSLPGGTWWLGCVVDGGGQSVIRRMSADGRPLGDTLVEGTLDFSGDGATMSAISPDRGAIFVWNPDSTVLTRIDLSTGITTTGAGRPTASVGGPLGALGRYLTPTAAAKVLLSSGVAVSPDGSRVFALGIRPSVDRTGRASSSGVYVFDASTLAEVDHWDARADFVSIAVSADGGSVYVAGSPVANDAGTITTQEASITVFASKDGSVRLVAGRLGPGFLVFPATIVR